MQINCKIQRRNPDSLLILTTSIFVSSALLPPSFHSLHTLQLSLHCSSSAFTNSKPSRIFLHIYLSHFTSLFPLPFPHSIFLPLRFNHKRVRHNFLFLFLTLHILFFLPSVFLLIPSLFIALPSPPFLQCR